MPRSHVPLSAVRPSMSDDQQALCFLAGANSIFYGENCSTTGNPDVRADRALLARLGLSALGHRQREAPCARRPRARAAWHSGTAAPRGVRDERRALTRRTPPSSRRPRLIDFSSNDYLGLRTIRPRTALAELAALRRHRQRRLAPGHGPPWSTHTLEEEVAAIYVARPRALLFRQATWPILRPSPRGRAESASASVPIGCSRLADRWRARRSGRDARALCPCRSTDAGGAPIDADSGAWSCW